MQELVLNVIEGRAMNGVEVGSQWRCKSNNEVVTVKSLLQRCVIYDMDSKKCHSDIVYLLNNFEPVSEVSE